MTTNVLPQLHYYSFSERVTAFSSTRHGGVGEGRYASFNINHYCGDNLVAIAENRRRLCLLLDIDEAHLVYPHQTHQTEVRQVDAAFLSLSETARARSLEGVDAVMTDQPGLCIGVSTADCIPIIIYDPCHHAAAAVHAGWRGTVAAIVRKTVRVMQEAYGTCPADCQAVVGPGISLARFEVGDEVYAAFSEAGFPMEHIARKYPAPSTEAGARAWKWHLDLPLCNCLQLMDAGVLSEKITMSGICTFDDVENYFSARRLGIQSGRIFTGILLR